MNRPWDILPAELVVSPFVPAFPNAIRIVPDSALRLSVVIVNTNTRDWLEGCLKSLEQQDVFDWIEVVVVDNASTDGSAAMVGRDFPSCRLVQLDEPPSASVRPTTPARATPAPRCSFC